MTAFRVRYSYLLEQFGDPEPILQEIRELLRRGDFTLGAAVETFEKSFAALIGTKHAVGVGSGTDALKLSLEAAGVGPGDEVITAANTFIATVGAINEIGAIPVLVDVSSTYTMDPSKIESVISSRTKAIMPVHLTGEPAEMGPVMEIAKRRGLLVVEDACQSIGAKIDDQNVGTFGIAAGFSLHPLKNLNVWGDGGIVVTDSDEIDQRLRLLRNHGLANRDEIHLLGHNSRLDTLQAIVGNWLIPQVDDITAKRIANAARYEEAFHSLSDVITLPPARPGVRRVYHLFMMRVQRRDALYKYLVDHGVEAKIHYPIPLHLQKGLAPLGYEKGSFLESERQAEDVITLPVDQHLRPDQVSFVIEKVKGFYGR